MLKIKLVETKEGATRLLVPDPKAYRIPERAPIFYNPRMARDRDVSVRIIGGFLQKPRVADVLCGLGARAVRYANECRAEVVANDIQPSAVALARRNARLNRVALETSTCDGNFFLLQNKYDRFDCVDIDPFGSPAEWLNSAFRALRPVGGLLCVTATDLGTLSGVYPKTCFRKYGLEARETSFAAELGARNLVAAAFREGAKYSIAVRPLLAYANIHYFRAFLATVGGRKATNRSIEREIGRITYCPKCERRSLLRLSGTPGKCECGAMPLVCGPTWIGALGDPAFLAGVAPGDALLGQCASEAEIAEPYWDVHALGQRLRANAPAMLDLIAALEERGYAAARTHFSGHGLRTNAPYEELRRALKK